MTFALIEITFRFGVLVVQFVEFLVIRGCKTAFWSDIYDQTHVALISNDGQMFYYILLTTYIISAIYRLDLCSLGQRDLLPLDRVGCEIVNRCGRVIILVSAHRCCNCNHESWMFETIHFASRLLFSFIRNPILLIHFLRIYVSHDLSSSSK